eukprot:CAMPEP_0174834008 /NCGR_PEP_ID=MMETSP1114-20130205/4582_1 /TAXON_ID=312471 /ORGANISM="Neobodo designis, Strain CCAP 1951/1" /LENGTH=140 /DNA_ID=CAMNT_0016067913 /DNA_START=46 /DNA_END=465 /DNA_ORIENTATION=+
MSSHFPSGAQADSRWETAKKIFFWRPQSIDEKRWARHALFRISMGLGMGCYFAYWHPEYSIISAWYHGSNEPIAHRAKPIEPIKNQDFANWARNKLGAEPPQAYCTESEPTTGGLIRDEAGNKEEVFVARAAVGEKKKGW